VAAASMPAIALSSVTKVYDGGDGAPAVQDVSLDIGEGEFFSLLGPSGCGKSTTLRIIAGFEQPTEGRVLLRGDDVTERPPARRDINLVFQAYALFPHMTVAENVGYGLRVRRVGRSETATRVADALRTVRLVGLDDRRPAQLSGGQQQRVALARALVNRPAALLLDEPLGALDLKLRREMQLELKAIQAETGTTFIYVTHDQDEALTMSDRIAVMDGGRIVQVAPPRTLYEEPATAFVAGFIGTSNTVALRVDDVDAGTCTMRLGDGERIVAPAAGSDRAGDVKQVTIRPERISLSPIDGTAPCSLVAATVRDVVYLGASVELIVVLPTGEQLTVRSSDVDEDVRRPGDQVTLHWQRRHSYVLGSSERPVVAERAPEPA
jgi:spermidine/putrescine transport system ATP-binding protein